MTDRLEGSRAEAGSPMGRGSRAVLLCDDRALAAEPVRQIGTVGKGAGAGAGIPGEDRVSLTRIWTFAELAAGELHAAVVRQAAHARLLAVASEASRPLPAIVRGVLVEEFLARLGCRTVLWYFARREARRKELTVGVEGYLRQLAKSFGAAFFVTPYFSPIVPPAGPPSVGLVDQLRGLPPFGVPHGGINE